MHKETVLSNQSERNQFALFGKQNLYFTKNCFHIVWIQFLYFFSWLWGERKKSAKASTNTNIKKKSVPSEFIHFTVHQQHLHTPTKFVTVQVSVSNVDAFYLKIIIRQIRLRNVWVNLHKLWIVHFPCSALLLNLASSFAGKHTSVS